MPYNIDEGLRFLKGSRSIPPCPSHQFEPKPSFLDLLIYSTNRDVVPTFMKITQRKTENKQEIKKQRSMLNAAAAAAAKSLQSCPTLRKPTDGSPPGSSIHGIFQARVLE